MSKGQLLARLDNPESASQLGQLKAETEFLQARSARLTAGRHGVIRRLPGRRLCRRAALRNARESAVRSKVAALNASADQARRDAGEAAATIQSLQGSLALAKSQVQMIEPLAAKHIVPQTDLLDKRREVIDLQGRIAAAREQQGKAQAAVREAQAQAAQANFEFRQSGARRAQSGQRQDRGQRAVAARRRGQAEPDRDPLASRRRRQRCPGHDHRRLRPARPEDHGSGSARRETAGRNPGPPERHRVHQGW